MVQVALTTLNTDLGHGRINTLEHAMRRHFWWPCLRCDTLDFCRMRQFYGSARPTLRPVVASSYGVAQRNNEGRYHQTFTTDAQMQQYLLVSVSYPVKYC